MALKQVVLSDGSDFASFQIGSGGIELWALQGNDGIDASGGVASVFHLGGGEDSFFRFGGVGGDKIYGDTGDDLINVIGNGSPTYVYGGPGWDVADFTGSLKGNFFYGGDDRDTILTGDVGSTFFGEFGLDSGFGGKGVDRFHGGGDEDFLDGGAGADLLWGDDGNDSLLGGAGKDTIRGGFGFDSLNGNTAEGGDGVKDVLFGGADGDFFELARGGGVDRLADLNFGSGDNIFVTGIGEITGASDSGNITTLRGTDGSVRFEATVSLAAVNAAIDNGQIFGLPIFDDVPTPPGAVPGSPGDFMM